MKRVVILGAGCTGLATGLGLVERGIDVEIYEASNICGGLAASGTIDGMYYDCGLHFYHTHDEQMKKFWKERFGDLLVEVDHFAANYKDGIYFEYPLSYEAIKKFPSEIKDQVLKELCECKPENLKRARNFKECVSALVGPTLQELFFEGYTEKLWGIPPEEMSSNWAPKRIEVRKKHLPFWHGQYCAVGRRGSGAIMQRLEENIIAKGGKVYLNHKAVKLNIKDSKIDSIVFDNGKSVQVKDTIVVSTIPLNVLCDTLGIKSDLKFNSLIFVYLMFNKDKIFTGNYDYDAVYYAHDDYYFNRVSEQKRCSAEGYHPDKTLLCLELSYNRRKNFAEMNEQSLIQSALRQFCFTGMIQEKYFIKGFTRKYPHVNPILEYGYERELARINSAIRSFLNLQTVGGNAEFIYGDMQTMFFKAKDMVDLLTSEHYVINRNIKRITPFQFNKEVRLCNFTVGGNNPSLIIAEIGLNHNGDLNLAKKLIDEAKNCGCEIAKLQTFSAANRVSLTAKSAKYADKTLQMEETTYEAFKRLELSHDDHIVLFQHAKKTGMPLISTPFDEQSIDLLCKLKVDAFKISSFDLVNLPFLKYAASKKIPIILSTGMSSLTEIEEALDAIASEGNPDVILMHCVSTYPSDPMDANLRVLETLRNAFKVPVGFSDHSIGPLVSIVAMTLGAHIIERHFTINRKFEGSDHILSSDPQEMKQLVTDRSIIFSALGTGVKKPSAAEYETINRQRKGIFARDDIKAGEKLTLDNITIKGPGHGLLPKYLKLILDKKVSQDIEKDEPVTWDHLLTQ